MGKIKNWVINLMKEIGFFVIFDGLKIPYLICMLFPVDQRSIFVNCFDGNGYNDNPKYIMEQLLREEPNLRIYWLNKNKKAIPPHQQITFVKPRSIPAIFRQATSKIWISTVRMPYYSIKRKEQVYIHTWHAGLALKKVEKECEEALSPRYIRTAKHDSTMIDYYISENQDNTDLFKNWFWYKQGEILEIGAPRNDILFQKDDALSQEIRRRYGLEGKRIVTYAPTFRKNESLEAYSIDYYRVLDALKQKYGGDWVFMVRLHPRISKKSDSLVSYDGSIIDASKFSDAQELLLITDVLITDYSSISTDFQIMNRPVFLFATDIQEYMKDRDFHIPLGALPFDIAENNDALINHILRFDEAQYSARLSAFREKYSYYDNGEASKTIARMIHSLIA